MIFIISSKLFQSFFVLLVQKHSHTPNFSRLNISKRRNKLRKVSRREASVKIQAFFKTQFKSSIKTSWEIIQEVQGMEVDQWASIQWGMIHSTIHQDPDCPLEATCGHRLSTQCNVAGTKQDPFDTRLEVDPNLEVLIPMDPLPLHPNILDVFKGWFVSCVIKEDHSMTSPIMLCCNTPISLASSCVPNLQFYPLSFYVHGFLLVVNSYRWLLSVWFYL